MKERLAVSRSVTLDGAGGGTASLGPQTYRENWNVTRMSTSGNSATPPALTVKRAGFLIDSTRYGNNDTTDNIALDVKHGETLTIAYEGGTPGAIMTYYLEGEIRRGV